MKVYVVFYDNGMMWEDNDVSPCCIFLNEKDAKDFCYDNNDMLRLVDELYEIENEYTPIKEAKFQELLKECDNTANGRKARNKYNECYIKASYASELFMQTKHAKLHNRLHELYNMGLVEVENYSYEPFEVLNKYIKD